MEPKINVTPSPPKPAPTGQKPGIPDWVRVPPGYSLKGVKKDRYFLISDELIPRKIQDLGPGLRLEDTGFGTYTVHRETIKEKVTEPAQPTRETEKSVHGDR